MTTFSIRPGRRGLAALSALLAGAGVTLAVVAPNALAASKPSAAPSHAITPRHAVIPAAGASWRSPVYLMPLDNAPPTAATVASVMNTTGEKDFILAFVLDSGGCTPAWDGNPSQSVASDTAVASLISAIRAGGGDAGVSFGGFNGTELGQSCGSAGALASAYQSVISKYRLTHVDFDIENTALGDSANELKRFQAIATLERNNPSLTVSLTIPMTTIGLPGTGTDEINQAKAAGARIDVFNAMDFDYGLLGGTQLKSDENVARDVRNQLKTLFGWTNATAMSHLGLTLMNGHSDQPSELFTQAVFTGMLGFAQRQHVAWLSFWSLNRDQQCPAGAVEAWAPGTCSNISQQPFDFTKIVARYAG